MAYWWCLLHQQVEGEQGCGHKDRLGPYATSAAAAHALDKARERNEDWDRQDDEYNRPGER